MRKLRPYVSAATEEEELEQAGLVVDDVLRRRAAAGARARVEALSRNLLHDLDPSRRR